jgi:DNA mismatch endonuclease (patch repair protein)
MQANRARGTGPERRLTRALREAGLPGYRLNWKRVPGRPDISYPGRRTAIFVHGCYWHHCPRCHPNLPKSNPEFWARKFELNRERDARKRRQLEGLGWQVHEIWECDIRDRLDERVRDIARDLARPALQGLRRRTQARGKHAVIGPAEAG